MPAIVHIRKIRILPITLSMLLRLDYCLTSNIDYKLIIGNISQ